ncbi:HIT domain-containing protein [Cytobacillus purgationiresistens]|uniref:Histidine triad (HIT) family protein n=1 Tax=Cytobacillus purgationiresistens TaxID=863449 RepID=A0ABU0ADY6_9BACI|nr:HIT domain-containing protein [Cytobacillus purgationiresistens]MDQ0268310.1 histidine triad (HIT) family protein [Cytobacillus purgationiresistens]
MTEDFYCDQVLNGKTEVQKLYETENVLAYYHTKPFYPVHIVTIPKQHIDSLLTIEDHPLLIEMLEVIKKVAAQVTEENGAARVLTNLGNYQDSKHLHWHIVHGEPLVK